ncbi:unnamed protein product [Cylicocyclus nassatus]|uniref:G protein-coupled receptor n=1 Tax=Cylicocyclus nassatus TaxID=53992 RepID=A0AA36GCD6_CYLNA|nr:unnamed protein product [Cylicocyclus nassatus]
MICLIEVLQFLPAITASLDGFLVISYTYVAYVAFANRDIFHPFFSILLSLLILSYAVSDVFELACCITSIVWPQFAELHDTLYEICEFVYFYASPCVVCLLLERGIASTRPREYEKARPWKMFWYTQPFCLIIAGAILYAARWTVSMTDDVQKAMLFIIQVVIIILLLSLLTYNKQRTKHSVGMGTNLGTRYQLSENIRALRVLLPVVICDLCVNFADIASEILFESTTKNDIMGCSNRYAVIFFIIFKSISFLFQIMITFAVMLYHPSFKKARDILHDLLCQTFCTGERKGLIIRNVLGMKINEKPTGENYFTGLRQLWQ